MLRSSTVLLLSLAVSASSPLAASDPSSPAPLGCRPPASALPRRVRPRGSPCVGRATEPWASSPGATPTATGCAIRARRSWRSASSIPASRCSSSTACPEGPLAVGPESESPEGVVVVLAGGCEWSGDYFLCGPRRNGARLRGLRRRRRREALRRRRFPRRGRSGRQPHREPGTARPGRRSWARAESLARTAAFTPSPSTRARSTWAAPSPRRAASPRRTSRGGTPPAGPTSATSTER